MTLSSKYHITTDDFTREKVVVWDEVEGNTHLGKYHKLGGYNIELMIKDNTPILVLWYDYTDRVANVGSVIVFLFEDGTILNFNVTEKPVIHRISEVHGKWAYHYIKLNEADINYFATKRLSKMRICLEDKYTTWTSNNESTGKPYDTNALLLMDYATAFCNAVKEVGVDFNELNAIDNTISSSEPCYVYLMCDISNGFYKIGISNHPQYREHTLQSEKPTIELVCAKQYPVRLIAEAIEAALHKAYDSKHLRGEWFQLTLEDVENLKQTLR